MALMTVIAPGDASLEWGWRVPFLLSAVLILVGFYIRRKVEESPVLLKITERKQQASAPISVLFKKHALPVFIAALVFAGNNAVGYMTTGGYIQHYATNPVGRDGFRGHLVAIHARCRDRLRQVRPPQHLYPRVGPATRRGVHTLPARGHRKRCAAFHGPHAALYAEQFPASIRFSGVSISYAIGAIIGGAFAPTIAEALVQPAGFIASALLRDRSASLSALKRRSCRQGPPIVGR